MNHHENFYMRDEGYTTSYPYMSSFQTEKKKSIMRLVNNAARKRLISASKDKILASSNVSMEQAEQLRALCSLNFLFYAM